LVAFFPSLFVFDFSLNQGDKTKDEQGEEKAHSKGLVGLAFGSLAPIGCVFVFCFFVFFFLFFAPSHHWPLPTLLPHHLSPTSLTHLAAHHHHANPKPIEHHTKTNKSMRKQACTWNKHLRCQ
jgi:quinol-cytochrome oxidoreductase complex cytochrome b subunit